MIKMYWTNLYFLSYIHFERTKKNEIQRIKYVDKRELDNLFEMSNNDDVKIGPWFRLIRNHFLDKIWENMESLKNLEDQKVHHMGEVNWVSKLN